MATELNARKSVGLQPVPVATNPDNIRAVYANNAGFGATMTDVQMFFTQVGHGTDANRELIPENRVVAIVMMPISQVPDAIRGLTAIFSAHQTNVEAVKKHIAAQKK